MKMHLPNSAFLGNIETFLKSIDPSDGDELEITFNPKWQALHPVVLSMVASAALKMKEEGKPIFCEEVTAKTKYYLARMGLLDYLESNQHISIREHESAGRFIPLRNIRTNGDLKGLLEDLTPLLHTTPDKAKAVDYVFSELIRNVLEHAYSKTGAMVCAQNFQRRRKNDQPNRVSIGVSDMGIGMKKSLSKTYGPSNDLEAIKLALTPGVTGTTRVPGGTSLNAGAGLFFIKAISQANRNFFMVYSGTGMYKLLKSKGEKISLNANPDHDRHSERLDLPQWDGVAVGVDVSLEQSEPFTELLKHVGKVYQSEKKDKKRNYYKGRFI